jgi:Replication-relaxation
MQHRGPASYCTAQWGELARPDGYGVWLEGSPRVPFILEYDRETESGPRLAEKLPVYRRLLFGRVSHMARVLLRKHAS